MGFSIVAMSTIMPSGTDEKIEETDGETTVITQSDINMSPAFANLMQWIDHH